MPVGPYDPTVLQGPGYVAHINQFGEATATTYLPKKIGGFGQSPMKARMGSLKRGFTKEGWFGRHVTSAAYDIAGTSAEGFRSLIQSINAALTSYYTSCTPTLPWGWRRYVYWDGSAIQNSWPDRDGDTAGLNTFYSRITLAASVLTFEACQAYGMEGPYIVVQMRYGWNSGGPVERTLITERRWNQWQAHQLMLPEIAVDYTQYSEMTWWDNCYFWNMTWEQYQEKYITKGVSPLGKRTAIFKGPRFVRH